MATKKLIEVALPLDKINAESAKEKNVRFGHPSTIHLWWARRPLATARAVLWSSLVDDPSSHPDLFPTEEAQTKERERLFSILEQLVLWKNSNNIELFEKAKAEIYRYSGATNISTLDPFAGGGAIPLESLRLGLNSFAHDLNPVAVTINKSVLEIPSRFAGMAPVNPEARRLLGNDSINGAAGLSEDVRYYGKRLKDMAFAEIGHLYPKVSTRINGVKKDVTPIVWMWARTVECPNPACRCKTPLVKSFVLCNTANKKARIEPFYEEKKLGFKVFVDKQAARPGTVGRKGAICACCGTPFDLNYIRQQSKDGKIDASLMAIIAEGDHERLYLPPDAIHESQALNLENINLDLGDLAYYPGYINPVAYGFVQIESLFTRRQKIMMDCFQRSLAVLQNEIYSDACRAGLKDNHLGLRESGADGATAYSQAIKVYLAFAIDKLADYNTSICSWHSSREVISHTFGMTGMSMKWDYCEANPFCSSSGCFDNMIDMITRCLDIMPIGNGSAIQHDAQEDVHNLPAVLVSTDPPYYNNVPYADFSDFFYCWLRKNIGDVYPELFATLQTPKVNELVADPYRAGGKDEAASFFEDGMLKACRKIYACADDNYPVSIYYAYKQSETVEDDSSSKTSSKGWETMLGAIIKSGFMITGTWPMRTEMVNRPRGLESNALASSIVLICRKRNEDAPQTTRRNLVNALRRDLRPALKKLQASNIAPVDLAQSAIGPGMAVFSQYRRVLEADGTPMTVRSALQVINEEIDLFFNEQVGSMDKSSRFCVDLYTQCAYNDISFGEAEVLANAKGTSIPMMASHGVLYAKAGIVHLVERENLPEKIDTNEGNIWMLTQQLTQAMAKGGVEACAQAVYNMFGSNAEHAKDLAYRLYTIAERKGWANEAYAYNSLVVAWPDIQTRAAELKAVQPEQLTMF